MTVVIHHSNGSIERHEAVVPEQPEAFITVEKAMEALNLSRVTLYKHLDAGRIRSIKLGYRRLIPASELKRLASEAA